MNEELSAILRTIKEVEVSLEHRYTRAEAVLVMIWGLAGASIFAFYQLVAWNHEVYHAALGEWVSWVWIVPLLVGYVASALVGARLGRTGVDKGRRRGLHRGTATAAVIAAVAALLVLTQRYDFIYGSVTALCGLALVLFAWDAPRGTTRTTSLGVGVAMNVVGVTLLVWSSYPQAPGIASLTFLVGYLTVGTVKYRAGA